MTQRFETSVRLVGVLEIVLGKCPFPAAKGNCVPQKNGQRSLLIVFYGEFRIRDSAKVLRIIINAPLLRYRS